MTATPLTFHLAETSMGWVGIVLSPRGLRAATLPCRTREEALGHVLQAGASEPALEESLGGLPGRIRRLVDGDGGVKGIAIDWEGLTPFQRAVMEETMRIPVGETRSYGWVAQQVGHPRAARAVGRVMATNPLPLVVPCHRVVGSDGGLHGFGGGLPMKESLLQAEGALQR